MIDESARIIDSLFYSLLLGNLDENVTSESWHKFVLDVILYKLAHTCIYNDVHIQLINLQPKEYMWSEIPGYYCHFDMYNLLYNFAGINQVH